MHDKLIYGKDETKRIVSIEAMESAAALEVFVEDENNNVSSHLVSNR
jgi:hypothetical protein